MAPVDPWSAGIMGATSVATEALQKQAQTTNAAFSMGFDNSGFVVNIGAGSASASLDKSTAILGNLLKNPVVLLGLVALVYMMHKK